MKQFLRLWDRYARKATHDKIHKREIGNQRNANGAAADMATGRVRDGSQTAAVSLAMSGLSAGGHSAVFAQRTPNEIAGILHEDPTMMRSRLVTGTPVGKAQPFPCPSPSSLTLPSVPIRICPAYTSVKGPKSGTLAKGWRIYSGGRGDKEGQYGRSGLGLSLYRAWELGLDSVLPRVALRLLRPNQAITETYTRTKPGSTELRRGVQESSSEDTSPIKEKSCVQTPAKVPALPGLGLAMGIKRFAKRLAAVGDWLEHGKRIVRFPFGQCSAFSRSVAEGLSKPSRTTVEAQSKDCRTSVEELSNTCRRIVEGLLPVRWPNLRWMGMALGVLLMLVDLTVYAQFHKPSDVTIRMGENLPESFFQTIHQAVYMQTGEETTIQLADYRNKLIILDFWASWCGPCIHSLNKLDSMRKDFRDSSYIVIPVTYQSVGEVLRTHEKYKWGFMSIVDDTTLGKVFPHVSIPHMVWIKDGCVAAIPKSDYATTGNISAMLEGKHPELANTEEDRMVDPAEPLFIAGNGDADIVYADEHAKITNHIPLYRAEGVKCQTIGDTLLLYAVNQSVEWLFYEAFKPLIFQTLDHSKGIQWEVTGPFVSKLLLNKPEAGINGDYQQDSLVAEWTAKHTYSVAVRVLVHEGENRAREVLRNALLAYFSEQYRFTAELVPGPLERYATLRVRENAEASMRLLSYPLENKRLDGMVQFSQPFTAQPHFMMNVSRSLHAIPELGLTIFTVIDSTGIPTDFPANFEFPKAMWNAGSLDRIQSEIARYGMFLTIEEKAIPMVRITNNKSTNF